jgi:hypothetical protein
MCKGNNVAFRIAGRVDVRARAGGDGAHGPQRRPPDEGIRQSKAAAGAGGTGTQDKLELPPSLAGISALGLFVGIFLLSVPVSPQVPVGITLGVAGLLLLVREPKDRTLRGNARALYVFGFLIATVFSVLASDAVLRSVRVSLLLLPLLLVFQAIGSRFDRELVGQLAWVLVVASGAVSLQFLITALTHLDQSPTQWVAATGLPFGGRRSQFRHAREAFRVPDAVPAHPPVDGCLEDVSRLAVVGPRPRPLLTLVRGLPSRRAFSGVGSGGSVAACTLGPQPLPGAFGGTGAGVTCCLPRRHYGCRKDAMVPGLPGGRPLAVARIGFVSCLDPYRWAD